jgi:hypothetical protein
MTKKKQSVEVYPQPPHGHCISQEIQRLRSLKNTLEKGWDFQRKEELKPFLSLS